MPGGSAGRAVASTTASAVSNWRVATCGRPPPPPPPCTSRIASRSGRGETSVAVSNRRPRIVRAAGFAYARRPSGSNSRTASLIADSTVSRAASSSWRAPPTVAASRADAVAAAAEARPARSSVTTETVSTVAARTASSTMTTAPAPGSVTRAATSDRTRIRRVTT